MRVEKLLIIRFSSMGDILQGLSVPKAFKQKFPNAEVHWLTKSSFLPLVEPSPYIDKSIGFDSADGLTGLIKLAGTLNENHYTHVYDAHNNLRSRLLSPLLKCENFVRRPKNRWKRLLLFKFKTNLFPKPFQGQKSFLEPLEPWGINEEPTQGPHFFPAEEFQGPLPSEFIAAVPSAAWRMKCWPIGHWEKLFKFFPDKNFVLLGGKEDDVQLSPLKELDNVSYLVGKTSLGESADIICKSQLAIGNDTGLMHMADLRGVPSVFLIGPTAFGYPSARTSDYLQTDLPCQPCSKDGRGKCLQQTWQKCLVDLTAEEVAEHLRNKLNKVPS